MTTPALQLFEAATRSPEEVLARLDSAPDGLTSAVVAERRAVAGPNAVRDHRARALGVLGRQLRSPLLVLLAVTAGASVFLGERVDAMVIGAILVASVGLGFGNEYRAERASQALHDRVRHTVVALRDVQPERVDVVELVPGDVIELELGGVVAADVRLIEAIALECDESVLTGESVPVTKRVDAVAGYPSITDLSSCALMGTVVHAGSGKGVVVATAARTEFGRIATGLGTRQPETEFQAGCGDSLFCS